MDKELKEYGKEVFNSKWGKIKDTLKDSLEDTEILKIKGRLEDLVSDYLSGDEKPEYFNKLYKGVLQTISDVKDIKENEAEDITNKICGMFENTDLENNDTPDYIEIESDESDGLQ